MVEGTGPDATADPAPLEPVPAPAPRRARRAGRNLPLAIATALILAGALLGTLFLSRPAFVAFVMLVVVLALLELLAALRTREMRPAYPVVLAMAAVLMAGAYLRGPAALPFALALTVLAAFGWYLVDRQRTEVTRNVAATVLATLYVPFLAAYLVLVVRQADHYVGALIGYAALTVVYDTFAYATGALLGRHQMAPAVSPNKSWEGAAGASVACLLAGAFLLPLWQPWSLAPGLALAGITCVVAPLGDLSESMLKRDLAVKDMGSLLPGHGGMLDRIDALLFTAPALYYVMSWFDLLRTP
ncbi:MAG TPA: phosphatidate cytidylyltransferase [Actinomycetes bacterium]|nr:phosphatidate cytidylyltransferase [Actinomycetes bacterium]